MSDPNQPCPWGLTCAGKRAQTCHDAFCPLDKPWAPGPGDPLADYPLWVARAILRLRRLRWRVRGLWRRRR